MVPEKPQRNPSVGLFKYAVRGDLGTMGYEPRMRGQRFNRPTRKKQSARERRKSNVETQLYQETAELLPSQTLSKTLNVLDNLGKQRFALPPFSEHFSRWLKDVTNVLADFETRLPNAMDAEYEQERDRILTDLRLALTARSDAEKDSYNEIDGLQQQLADCEAKLSKIEHDHKMRMRETRRLHEDRANKLRREIEALDRQRLVALRKRTSFLGRIFHRSQSEAGEATFIKLERRRGELQRDDETAKEETRKIRTDHDKMRKQLLDQQGSLSLKMAELRNKAFDDALETRRLATQELIRVVTVAAQRVIPGVAPNDMGNQQ